jgi:hypothetical protein
MLWDNPNEIMKVPVYPKVGYGGIKNNKQAKHLLSKE